MGGRCEQGRRYRSGFRHNRATRFRVWRRILPDAHGARSACAEGAAETCCRSTTDSGAERDGDECRDDGTRSGL